MREAIWILALTLLLVTLDTAIGIGRLLQGLTDPVIGAAIVVARLAWSAA